MEETMSEDLNKIKTKIEALLAKANDTAATEAEADAFNRKAHELMTRYNIKRSELGAEEEVERTHMKLQVQLRPWAAATLTGITKLYFCKYFSRKLDAKGRKHEITIVGEKQNVMVCHAIAVMVLRSIQAEARASGDGRSFMTGAGYRVYERCMEMTAYAEQTTALEATKAISGPSSGGNALVVLAKSEQSANDEYIAKTLGIQLSKAPTSRPKINSGSGFARGQAHGNKVQLRRNLLN
jgi:hypothetical protein